MIGGIEETGIIRSPVRASILPDQLQTDVLGQYVVCSWLDGKSWVSCRENFFLSVCVLSRLFRRLFLSKLALAHKAGQLVFFGKYAKLADAKAFTPYLALLRKREWVVYSKRPFGGPEEVLRYLARYTHRVAISNRRLIACDEKGVTFKWKDYRIEGPEGYKTMTLATDEFIRRFLMCCPLVSTASVIMECSTAASVPRTSRAPANCSRWRQ
jgi:hypothetical protein